jgi:hypothetical protein
MLVAIHVAIEPFSAHVLGRSQMRSSLGGLPLFIAEDVASPRRRSAP